MPVAEERSEWFRHWCFWGWQDVPDYSALVSVGTRHRCCSGAAMVRPGEWSLPAADKLPAGPQRASILSAWRTTTKRIARNEELRSGQG